MYQKVMDVSVFLGEENRHDLETIKEEDHPEVVLYCLYGRKKSVIEQVAGCMAIGFVVLVFISVAGLATVGVENVVFFVLFGIGVFVFCVLTVSAMWINRRWCRSVQTYEPKGYSGSETSTFIAPDDKVLAKP